MSCSTSAPPWRSEENNASCPNNTTFIKQTLIPNFQTPGVSVVSWNKFLCYFTVISVYNGFPMTRMYHLLNGQLYKCSMDPLMCFIWPTARIETQWFRREGIFIFCFFEYVVYASMHMHNHADLIHSIIYISLTSVTSGRLLSPRLPMDQSSAVWMLFWHPSIISDISQFVMEVGEWVVLGQLVSSFLSHHFLWFEIWIRPLLQ